MELAAAFEVLGVGRYKPAEAVIRDWLPIEAADRRMFRARIAAFWAIGQLYTGNPEPEIVQVVKREAALQGGEVPNVEAAAMTALAQMGATQALHEIAAKYPSQSAMVAGQG